MISPTLAPACQDPGACVHAGCKACTIQDKGKLPYQGRPLDSATPTSALTASSPRL